MGLYYPYSENKGADQLCGYREADLRLCFRPSVLSILLCIGSLIMIITLLFSLGVISGNKMNNIEVVYTMWENLKKTGSMDVGQVGFHKQKEVFITKNYSCKIFNGMFLIFFLFLPRCSTISV